MLIIARFYLKQQLQQQQQQQEQQGDSKEAGPVAAPQYGEEVLKAWAAIPLVLYSGGKKIKGLVNSDIIHVNTWVHKIIDRCQYYHPFCCQSP